MNRYRILWIDGLGFKEVFIDADNVVKALSICFQKNTITGEIKMVTIKLMN